MTKKNTDASINPTHSSPDTARTPPGTLEAGTPAARAAHDSHTPLASTDDASRSTPAGPLAQDQHSATPPPGASGIQAEKSPRVASGAAHGGHARQIHEARFSRPVKMHRDVPSTNVLTAGDDVALAMEGPLLVATFKGASEGTTGAMAWPLSGGDVREIVFSEVPSTFTGSPGPRASDAERRRAGRQHEETPQGAGAPSPASGEAVSSTGAHDPGKKVPPVEGQEPRPHGR